VNASVDQLWLSLKDKVQNTAEQYVSSKMTGDYKHYIGAHWYIGGM